MIYLFTGTDVAKVRAKAFAWVSAAQAKAPDAIYVRLHTKEISAESLSEISGTQGLFFSKTLAVLDEPFAESAVGEVVLAHLEMLQASPNPIAILAPKLLSARQKKIEAKADKVFVCDSVQKKTARGFNSELVNALGAKDRHVLWKELMLALRQGDAPEAVHGLLHWKARDMMAKGNSKWGRDGARKLSRELIVLVSDARGGGLPLAQSLERFVLSI